MHILKPFLIYFTFNHAKNTDHFKKVQFLVNENINLLHYFGNNYRKKHNLDQNRYNDLIQDAYFGLHRAAEKYDENRSVKFGTHASWWIKAYMTQNLKNYYKNKHLPLDEKLMNVAYYDQLGFINTSFLNYKEEKLIYLRYDRCFSYKKIGQELKMKQHTVIKKHKEILNKIKIENKI